MSSHPGDIDLPSVSGCNSWVPDPSLGLSVNACEQSVYIFGLCAPTCVCQCVHVCVCMSPCVCVPWVCAHHVNVCLPAPSMRPKTGPLHPLREGGECRSPRWHLQEPLLHSLHRARDAAWPPGPAEDKRCVQYGTSSHPPTWCAGPECLGSWRQGSGWSAVPGPGPRAGKGVL